MTQTPHTIWQRIQTTAFTIYTKARVHQHALLLVANGLLALISVLRLGEGFWRLLFDPSTFGAVDLRLRYHDVLGWFQNQPIYTMSKNAVYPPASYLLLSPLGLFKTESGARLAWAVVIIFGLLWMSILIWKYSGAQATRERVFLILLYLSNYSVSFGVGNGQLILLILPCLTTALLLLMPAGQKPFKWWAAGAAAFLFLIALVKPTLTAPFFWIVLFGSNGLILAFLIVTGYGLLTLAAATFQTAPLPTLISQLASNSADVMANNGYGNLAYWLSRFHLQQFISPASLAVLGLLGLWLYFNRTRDRWILVGITAVVARLWTYFFFYDDMIVFLAVLAVARIVAANTTDETSRQVGVGVLAIYFGVGLISQPLFGLWSAYLLDLLPNLIFPASWVLLMAFLVWQLYKPKAQIEGEIEASQSNLTAQKV